MAELEELARVEEEERRRAEEESKRMEEALRVREQWLRERLAEEARKKGGRSTKENGGDEHSSEALRAGYGFGGTSGGFLVIPGKGDRLPKLLVKEGGVQAARVSPVFSSFVIVRVLTCPFSFSVGRSCLLCTRQKRRCSVPGGTPRKPKESEKKAGKRKMWDEDDNEEEENRKRN